MHMDISANEILTCMVACLVPPATRHRHVKKSCHVKKSYLKKLRCPSRQRGASKVLLGSAALL